MNAGTMGRDEAVEVLAALVDFVCAEMRGLESKPKLKAAIATLRAQSSTEERRGLAEAWRDVAIFSGNVLDEIREIVGLTGKPGNVVEAVRKLVALRDGEAKQPAETSNARGEVEYEYEVWQGDVLQAGGSTTDYASATLEANHYAMMYSQDGPVEVIIYEKRRVVHARRSQQH